jgi:hypothetical protein
MGVDGSLGLQAAFTGGPVLSAVGILELNDNLSFNLPVGGFPGIIFRTEMNCRYGFSPLNKFWSTYLQGGFGYSEFYRGKGEGKTIRDVHCSFGMNKIINTKWEFYWDAGFLYIPGWANRWWKEEFDKDIGITPSIVVGFNYNL